MSSVNTFMHLENIKRYKVLLANERDRERRTTLEALLATEQAALQEVVAHDGKGAGSEH